MSGNTHDEATAVRLTGFREIFDNEVLLVDAVCEQFFREHPDYDERFRRICREDTAHNIRYLACSVESGRFELFHYYLLWLRELLEKRDIPVQHLTESLALMREELEPYLQDKTLAVVREFLDRGMVLMETPWSEISEAEIDPELQEPATRYLEMILAGDRRRADRLISELSDQGYGYVDLIVDVIQPAMVRIGRLWQSNEISVAREHLATAITQNTLSRCLMLAEPRPPIAFEAVFSCVEGNQHSLGLRITADAFELEGWKVHYLGADTPRESLFQYIRDSGPELVGLSISLPQHILQVRDIVEAVRGAKIGKQPFILVGGHIADHLAPLLYDYGADGVCGNVRDCLQYMTP